MRFAETKVLKKTLVAQDAVVGMAKRSPEWKNHFIPCTKTIYNLIDTRALSIINIDIALKVKRSTKKMRPRENKRIMGPSSRRAALKLIPVKNLDAGKSTPLLERNPIRLGIIGILIERKTRKKLIIRLDGKDAESF